MTASAEQVIDTGGPVAGQRRRVLMFAYVFPPFGGGGVQRTLKFVKYLPDAGFDSIVVTSVPRRFPIPRDETLLGEVPPGTVVARARTLPLHRAQGKVHGLFRRLGLPTDVVNAALVPDELVGWVPAAVYHGIRAVRGHRPDVIYSTSPPVTDHLAAWAVHRLTGLPWVADFRDGWTFEPGPFSSSVPPGWITSAVERRLVASATRTVVACDSIRLVGLPRDDPRRMVIPNGVDPEDIPVTDVSIPEVASANGVFRLAHVGALYGSRNAAPVITALRQLIASGRLDPGRLSLRVIGHGPATRVGDGIVPSTFTGYVDHARAVQEMMAASALLFHQPPEQLGSSGKIYEYLISGRPVLCVAHPDNVAYRLVSELGAGECADARDVASVTAALERMIGRWSHGRLMTDPTVREKTLLRFSRKKLTADLARVLDAAIAGETSAFHLDDPSQRLSTPVA